jgi:hypothetical protein
MSKMTSRRVRITAFAASLIAAVGMVVALPTAAVAGPVTTSTTFTYTGSTSTFTVPTGVTSLTVTVVGGEGGNGGADSTPAPPTGGYQGVVTGTLSVSQGQQLTVGVGNGGTATKRRCDGVAVRLYPTPL